MQGTGVQRPVWELQSLQAVWCRTGAVEGRYSSPHLALLTPFFQVKLQESASAFTSSRAYFGGGGEREVSQHKRYTPRHLNQLPQKLQGKENIQQKPASWLHEKNGQDCFKKIILWSGPALFITSSLSCGAQPSSPGFWWSADPSLISHTHTFDLLQMNGCHCPALPAIVSAG